MANGVASTLDLVPVPGAPDRLMRREAARQMGALRVAFQAHFGVPLYLAETFRSLDTQWSYYRTYPKGAAAYPGTSFHGTGDAADCWTGVDKYGTPQHNWMQANAPAFGFTNTQGKATRSSRYPNGEAHHWVYVGRPTVVAGLDIEEIDMPITEAEMNRIAQKAAETVWNITALNPANGQQTRYGDLVRYGEQSDLQRRDELLDRLPARILDAPIPRAGEAEADGTPKFTSWRDWVSYTQKFADYARGGDPVDLDEAELGAVIAAKLAPIVAASVGKLTDAEIDALAKAVVDEQARRLTNS